MCTKLQCEISQTLPLSQTHKQPLSHIYLVIFSQKHRLFWSDSHRQTLNFEQIHKDIYTNIIVQLYNRQTQTKLQSDYHRQIQYLDQIHTDTILYLFRLSHTDTVIQSDCYRQTQIFSKIVTDKHNTLVRLSQTNTIIQSDYHRQTQ